MGGPARQDVSSESGAENPSLVPPPPTGMDRVRWLGPGFLWMIAALGSGELLFTPRVGAQYGYALLWAFLASVTLKWFVNREIGRFAVCTGKTVVEGFAALPGPRHLAVWVIIVPQLFVAATSLAGFASAAATSLILVFPGPIQVWSIAPLIVSAVLVVWGRYRRIELLTRVFAVVLAGATLYAAVSVAPSPAHLLSGLRPQIPADADLDEILPWVAYALSGAVGLIWYSFWMREKGYGLAAVEGEPPTPESLSSSDRIRLRGWIHQMSLDVTLAVTGAVIVTLAFLVLGVELLQPRRLAPEENRIAWTLGTLLEGTLGRCGFWLMVGGVFVGFFGTILTNQDGFGRLFAQGVRILSAPYGWRGVWGDEERLRKLFVLVLATLAPAAVYLRFGEPVGLLKLSGIIEAFHLPIVTGLVLYLNHRRLPRDLRPSRIATAMLLVGALFFAGFAAIYVRQIVGGGA